MPSLTFERRTEREDADIVRFWIARRDGVITRLAVIRWSGEFIRRVNVRARHSVAFDETDAALVANRERIEAAINDNIRRKGTVNGLKIALIDEEANETI